MQRIVQFSHGVPAEVLALEHHTDAPGLASGKALVRVSVAPIHPGDLLGIAASPSFGTPPVIPEHGRTPGFEGVGIITALPADGDHSGRLKIGTRVAFFPVDGAWSSDVVAPMESLVVVPDDISDGVASQMMINTLTARIAFRAGIHAVPEASRGDIRVIQTAANSAVAKVLTHLLQEAGIKPALLVRTASSAAALKAAHPDLTVIVSGSVDWQEELRQSLGDAPFDVVFDGVGGTLLSDVAGFLVFGGTVISYGSLDEGAADIRAFAPRALSIRGVSLFSWFAEPVALRDADVLKAVALARDFPFLFPEEGRYPTAQYHAALQHAVSSGRTGTVLLTF